MNNLLYSNIDDYYDSNNSRYNLKLNTNLENLNYKKKYNYNYNENFLDEILLCKLSRDYLKTKLLNENLIQQIIAKILNLDTETVITLLIGMLILLFIKNLFSIINFAN